MKTEYKPIAMRCTQEQFDSIKDRIPLEILRLGGFDFFPFLVIKDGYVTNDIVKPFYVDIDIHEIFNGELFLYCCGREKEKYITQEQKDNIIKEYLKDKVWKGSELQFRQIFNTGQHTVWEDCFYETEYRLKKQPDYSKEIEALENKAKENGQKVIIKFEGQEQEVMNETFTGNFEPKFGFTCEICGQLETVQNTYYQANSLLPICKFCMKDLKDLVLDKRYNK